MDDEAQKMAALKKAYAEIILNTAKEAAARIMVSERKVLRFQQDLSASKEEALRMLLRLKQMIDSKTTEAELTSLNQQRRIEELEEQLEEAEEVITELRAQLKQIGDEFEKVKNNQVPKTSAPFPSSGCETMETSDMNKIPKNQRSFDNRCCSTTKQTNRLSSSQLHNFDHSKLDLSSIIMRSKKPDLYRNGCIQRIRAFEINLLDENSPSSGDVDTGNSLVENEFVTKAADKELCKPFSLKRDKVEMDKKFSQGERKRPIKVRTSRRRKTRFGKDKTSRRSHPSQLLKSGQPYSVMTESSDGLRENFDPEICNIKNDIPILYKGQRIRTSKSWNHAQSSSACYSGQLAKPYMPSPLLSRCRTIAYLLHGGIGSVEDELKTCENGGKTMKPLPQFDSGLTLIKSDMNSISASTSATVDVKATNRTGKLQHATEKDLQSKAEDIMVKKESIVVEDSSISSSELNIEMTNVSPINCDLDTTEACEQVNESPCHVDKNRMLKYTFQRKRKKEGTGSSDNIASPEKSSVKRKTVEEYTAPEPQKSSLMNESSRDSRRLAQVARQLISLSGRRWR